MVTQTATTPHKGNQYTVIGVRMLSSVALSDSAATNKNDGVAIKHSSAVRNIVCRNLVAFGTLRRTAKLSLLPR